MAAGANLLLRKGIEAAGGFSTNDFTSALTNFLHLLTEPLFILGFLLYFAAALIWFRIIATEPLGIAYPMLVSLSFILVTAGTAFFLQEPISLRLLAGILLIIGGIILISGGAPA